jgi:hypothetical protein
MSQYIMGLDPAQLKDWSALVITKRAWNEDENQNHYQIVAMNRKQHMPYNEIVDWVIRVFRDPQFWPNQDIPIQQTYYESKQPRIDSDPELVIDSTGVGRALWDMFRSKGINPVGASITAGSGLNVANGVYSLGKSLLLGRFMAAWDAGKVKGNPDQSLWHVLEDEMAKYRIEFTKSGSITFNAPEGEHDDLLFAAALSIWWPEESRCYQ